MIVKVKKVKNQGWGTNQVKAYEGTKTKVIPSIDRNGNYNTGLTLEDEARLEPLLGLQKGNLNKSKENKWWSQYNDGLGYFIEFTGNTPLILDTEIPEHELSYLVLKGQKRVAKSVKESTHPSAQFVIFNEEDEADKENKRGKNKRQANSLFETLSVNEMRNVLLMYGKNAESSSPAIIENQLSKLMDEDPLTFLVHAKDPHIKNKVFILSLVSAGILTRKGGAFIESVTEDILAYDMDTMIQFLDEKKNNGKLIQFKEALKNK